MLYLKASSEIEVLDEYNGEKGIFYKTFAINDRRNKNGWRVTWDSIPRYIRTFQENARPGIEFVKCEGTVCDLDHTDGITKEHNVQVQEDFRVTTIIDHTLDEEDHKAFFIHRLEPGNEDFHQKVLDGEIEFVSPSVWPEPGGYDVVGTMPSGRPMLDVYIWDGLHDAFLTKDPAYGDEARITAICEGEDCAMKLLTAKQYEAADEELQEKIKNVAIVYPEWTENAVREKAIALLKEDRAKNGSEDLAPLQQVPILVKHKDHLQFVSVSKCVAKKLQANLENDIAITEESLMRAIEESKIKADQNTSFSTCSCSANQMPLTANEEKELRDSVTANEDKVKELESKLKANEEEHEKVEAKLKAKLSAAEDDDSDKVTEAKKAQSDAEEEAEKAKKGAEDTEKENETLKAKITAPLIARILEPARERLSTEQFTQLETSLKAKSLPELEEAIIMSNLSASTEERISGTHFEFSDSNPGPLTGKSLEDTFQEVTA